LFQSITATPVRKCPACKKNGAKRLIGAGASIIFRGSGFYQTDYRSDGYKKAAKADAEAASGGKKDKAPDGKPSATTSSSGSGGSKGPSPD
jgi:predicted nucleic acid-binding Zn ribbon protein